MQPENSQKKAYDFALKWISIHPRTVFEIRNKLKEKDFSPKIIDQIIKKLEDQEYLNDQQYAEAWLEERIKNRPSGRALCWKKLREKGIKREIINKVLNEILPEEKEIELARELVKNKKALLKARKIHHQKIPRRIAFFLQNRGFSASTIREALEI